MTPAQLDAAKGLARVAAHKNIPDAERVTGVRIALACLGIIPGRGVFDPLPTTCGHPSSALVRDPVRKGNKCKVCVAEHDHVRKAAMRAARKAAS